MKYIRNVLFAIIFIFVFQNVAYSYTCDQTYYRKLRYGYSYTFHDTFTNNSAYTVGFDKIDINYDLQANYDGTGTFPSFPFTSQMVAKDYELHPGETYKVVQANRTYPLRYHPRTRSRNNLVIRYTAKYYSRIGGKWVGPKSHTECEYNTITWCGDGVLDNYTEKNGITIKETCDPADPNKTNWGNGGCNSSCQPITIPTPPSCSNLSVNPTSGNAPLSSNMYCTGVNTTNYRIDIANAAGTRIQTINANAGSYNFTTPGTYTATCYAEGKTAPACQKTITVSQPPTVTPKIQVDKRDANTADLDGNVGNDTQTVRKGEKAVFKITVTNNGTEDLRNVYLTDPNASACNRTVAQTTAILRTIGNGDAIFNVGESFSYTCEKANTQSAYTNTINVSGVGVTSGTTVTDSDPTDIILNLSCDSLTASPTSAKDSLTSTLTCSGKGNENIVIDCGNGNKLSGRGILRNGVYSFSGVCNYNSVKSYTPSCKVGGETSNNCKTTVTVTGGSSPSRCEVGTRSGAQSSPITSSSSGLCRSGISVNNFGERTVGNITYYTWGCGGSITGGSCSATYTSGGPSRCRVGTRSGTQSSPITSSSSGLCESGSTVTNFGQRTVGSTIYYTWGCGGSVTGGSCSAVYRTSTPPGNYCGDGVLQRPNDDGQNEECDFGSNNTDTPPTIRCGTNTPAYCTTDCKLRGTITCPGEISIELFPKTNNYVLGHNMNLFTSYSLQRPWLKLVNYSGGGEIDLNELRWKLCLVKKGGDSLSGRTICESVGSGRIRANENYTNYLNMGGVNFIGNINKIPNAHKYSNNKLIITLGDDSGIKENAYFAETLNVRVARPSVVTTGGGTSYIEKTNKISDTSKVSYDENKNKNFSSVGVSKNLSSTTKNVESSESAKKESKSYSEKLNTSSESSSPASSETNFTGYGTYNGIQNTYYLKKKNLTLGNINYNGLLGGKPVTIVVEDGDLIINNDIKYNGNIAFVVKGGNIKVNNNVKELQGTYIAIPKKVGASIVGGKIDANSVYTTKNRLIVKGSLYGDTAPLLEKRTYMKLQGNQLNVGTIVSFGSSVFRKPAPLTSSFINEYHKAKKIAR